MLITEIGKTILLVTISYVLIKLIPSFGKFLEKEIKEGTNPVILTQPFIEKEQANFTKEKFIEQQTELEELEKLESNMDRIFINPDFSGGLEKNFENLGEEKV